MMTASPCVKTSSATSIRKMSSSPKGPSSSQFVWQAGTAAALVATYYGVTTFLNKIPTDEDDLLAEGGDGQGVLRSARPRVHHQ